MGFGTISNIYDLISNFVTLTNKLSGSSLVSFESLALSIFAVKSSANQVNCK